MISHVSLDFQIFHIFGIRMDPYYWPAQECVGMEVECKNQDLGCKWATWIHLACVDGRAWMGLVGMAISNGTCLDRQLRGDFASEKPRRDYSTHFVHLKYTLKKSETNELTKLFCILQEKCVASWQL